MFMAMVNLPYLSLEMIVCWYRSLLPFLPEVDTVLMMMGSKFMLWYSSFIPSSSRSFRSDERLKDAKASLSDSTLFSRMYLCCADGLCMAWCRIFKASFRSSGVFLSSKPRLTLLR